MFRRRPQAFRAIQHDQHHREAVQQLADDFGIDDLMTEDGVLQRTHGRAQEFRKHGEQHRAQDHARDVAHAAEHHAGEHHDRFPEGERFRRYESLERAEHRARQTAERRTHRKRQQLHVTRVDAHCFCGDFVLADRGPCTADPRVLQAHAHEDHEERTQHEQVVVVVDGREVEPEQRMRLRQIKPEQRHRIDARDPLRPVRDVDRTIQVVHEDPDDFPEAQGHDGEIIAAQTKRRRTQQHAERGGQRHRAGNDDPDRRVQAAGEQVRDPLELRGQLRRRKQRSHISAHGVERDVAQVQQPGETHHHVQAQREHDVQHREVEHADPVVAAGRADQHGREDHERGDQHRDGVILRGLSFGDERGRRLDRLN
ncbi:hypothetical protein PAMC26510_22210 [Caballeronia sordidicola]|uniref:Uncharacterized protein n=1 Tax=Caballeronia sordidicola TaxID=196367 RepID=A0A242MLV9_CABSO|nr:hypothetical protein PAMC26510_22210 [Caballeronia sordidicola]